MSTVKDGELYKAFEIEGIKFEIYYGYESDGERRCGWEPTPIYPNFSQSRQYTEDGVPFTLAYSDVCKQYSPIDNGCDDSWCANCSSFDRREQFIGLCKNEKSKLCK